MITNYWGQSSSVLGCQRRWEVFRAKVWYSPKVRYIFFFFIKFLLIFYHIETIIEIKFLNFSLFLFSCRSSKKALPFQARICIWCIRVARRPAIYRLLECNWLDRSSQSHWHTCTYTLKLRGHCTRRPMKQTQIWRTRLLGTRGTFTNRRCTVWHRQGSQ